MENLSIMGLYQYNPRILDGLIAPSDIDREVLVNTILMECAELEVIYPDWSIMQHAITMWSRSHLWEWERLAATMRYQYDPIANYDRTEERTESGNNRESNSGQTSNNATSSGTSTAVDEGTQYVWAFNQSAGDRRPAEAHSNNSTSTASNAVNGSSNSSGQRQGDFSTTETIRAYGNIGVTTTQQMIAQERESVQFNLVQHIVMQFKSRFCLMVY